MGFGELLTIMELIGKVGVPLVMSGVMVFVLLFMLRVMLPAKDKQHQAERQAADLRHEAEMERARTDFREVVVAKDTAHAASILALDVRQTEELRTARADYREALERVIADGQRSQERILAHCQEQAKMREEMMRGEVAEVSAAIIDFRRTLEEFRDALAQLAPPSRRRGGGGADLTSK